MGAFHDLWKNTGGRVAKQVQLVCEYETKENGRSVRVFASEHEYAEWLMEMGPNITVVGIRKSGEGQLMQKPGASTHTAKWDRCVEQVKARGGGADPYAVCTAMLGDESFKSMDEAQFDAVLGKALEEVEKDIYSVGQVGIAAAGPIPRSRLARQDLEGSSTSKGFTSQEGLIARIKAGQKGGGEKPSSFRDAWSRVKPR